ncbi:MAG: hypothetical protein K6C08_04050 [Oscillospiraceae bacterium]|nr:hypothetical protein [Oscillospiraceae bacterium]
MNRRLSRWLLKKAEQALGEEEMASLKNDILSPVKTAVKDAVIDIMSDFDEDGDEAKHP